VTATAPDATRPPEFIVETPASRPTERAYALAVLFGEWLGVRHTIGVDPALTETRIRLAGRDRGPVVVLPDRLLGPATAWLSPDSLPGASIASIDAPAWTGFDGLLPLLFASAPAGDGLVAVDGDRFELRLDLLGSIFFLLSRYEEAVAGAPRDERDRSPAAASVLGRTGWLEWPVLDMYVTAFRGLIERAWPGLVLDAGGPGRAVLSHDVDHPSSRAHWRGSHALRVVAGDAIHRRDLGLAARRAVSLLPTRSGVGPFDPYAVFDFLMSTSEARGIRSTFFFLTRETEVPDGSRYRVDQPWARRLIAEIGTRGHRIGLHGSYHSFDDPDRLRAEWALLEGGCAGLPPDVLRRAIRQHFLRFRAGDTWRAQVEAGLEEDESLGFADAVGYRAGTARSFTGYDIARGGPLPMRVIPLHVMDVTLLQRMAKPLPDRLATVADMARRTGRHGGALSLLWHNSSLETRAARETYLALVQELFGVLSAS
jgi:peptidoglycan/xylan/chitin deacetylase (PgdA/CDA1 family)